MSYTPGLTHSRNQRNFSLSPLPFTSTSDQLTLASLKLWEKQPLVGNVFKVYRHYLADCIKFFYYKILDREKELKEQGTEQPRTSPNPDLETNAFGTVAAPLGIGWTLGGSLFFILSFCLFSPEKLQPSKEIFPPPLCFQSTILQASEPNILWPSVQMSVSSASLGLTFVFPAPHTITGWNRCSVSACCVNE